MPEPKSNRSQAPATWDSVEDIPGFPFRHFEELQGAVSDRSYSIGVNSLAAAEWSARAPSGLKQRLVTVFSMLLIAAVIASLVAAAWLRDYWLIATPPIVAVTFYLSHPGSPFHRWVTFAGALSLALFLNLLLNGIRIGAILVAYGGLTFALVRAAGFLTNQSFRRALIGDEQVFLRSFARSECTLRENRTKQVYSFKAVSKS